VKRLWHSILEWFEYGDLVPFIVIVSAVHFATILTGHDIAPVAVMIGILVDLGTYRWVRAATRYQVGKQKSKRVKVAKQRQLIIRWSLAIGMSVISFLYHLRFYGDLALAIPLPLLVISLAWLAETDKRKGAQETLPKIEITTVKKPELPEVTENLQKVSEKLPEKSDWRTLPAEDKQLISGMTAQEVMQKYAVSERTAYNWKQSVKDNVPDIARKNGHKAKQEAR